MVEGEAPHHVRRIANVSGAVGQSPNGERRSCAKRGRIGLLRNQAANQPTTSAACWLWPSCWPRGSLWLLSPLISLLGAFHSPEAPTCRVVRNEQRGSGTNCDTRAAHSLRVGGGNDNALTE